MSDFEQMTPGMIIGYIITYNNENMSEDEKEDTIRVATQADFDRF